MKSIFLKLLLFFNLFTIPMSLTPQNLPNGKGRKFFINKIARSKDLKLLTSIKIQFILKHWENILYHSTKEICEEDKYIMQKIDVINNYIKQHTNVTDLYFAWMPQGVYKEVLFIVVGELSLEDKVYTLKHILHSPFWDNKQIENIHLKYALEDMVVQLDDYSIDYTYFYENDKRYKFGWQDFMSETTE
tara:strand:- start:69 stop:635 length:567 start_codon:yes stop_codon:yes gene_type:complete